MSEIFSSEAPELDLIIAQGASFLLGPMQIVDEARVAIDLLGATAQMHIRSSADAPTILFDASPYLTISVAEKTLTLSIPEGQTRSFVWPSGVYDLELAYADGTVQRLLRGTVTVTSEVTR